MPTEPRSRHGLNALKARVKVRGLHAIDRRTVAGRALIEFRRRLVADLGGADHITAQQQALVETAARTKLFIDALDGWLMTQPSLVNGRKRTVLPVLRERQAMAESLGRTLQALGLERREPPTPEQLELRRMLDEDARDAANGLSARLRSLFGEEGAG